MQRKSPHIPISAIILVAFVIPISFELGHVAFFESKEKIDKQQNESSVTEAILGEMVQNSKNIAEYYTKHLTWSNNISNEDLYDTALAFQAMHNSKNSLEPETYALMVNTKGSKSVDEIEERLVLRAGICGNQVALFLQLTRLLGLESRSVEFYDRKNNINHTAAEVKINNEWKFFDVTWGTTFKLNDGLIDESFITDLLSIDQIRSEKNVMRYSDESDLQLLLQYSQNQNPFFYKSSDVDVLRGKEGKLSLKTDEAGKINISGKPNYIGSTQDYPNGKFGNLAWSIDHQLITDLSDKKIVISSSATNCPESYLELNGSRMISPDDKTFVLPLPAKQNDIEVGINSHVGLGCYRVIDSIEIMPIS